MRVALVEQQQVEYRNQLRGSHVASAVGDRAVAQFQQPVQCRGIIAGADAQEATNAVAEKLQAFDAAADHQEAPAIVAGHVVEGETRQCGQRDHQPVEHIQQLPEIAIPPFQALQVALQFHHGLPVGLGQLAAHAAGRPLQALQVDAHAGRPLGTKQRLAQARLQRAMGFTGQGAQFLGEREHRLQRPRVVIVIDVTGQHDAQQPRVVFAAFAVAPEPEQVFHHPRGQIGIAAHQIGSAQRPRALPLLTRRLAFAQHPGVLADATALHGHHFAVGCHGHPGQAARHHPVTVAAGHGEHAHADSARLHALLAEPHRRLGQLYGRLGHIGLGMLAQAAGQLLGIGAAALRRTLGR